MYIVLPSESLREDLMTSSHILSRISPGMSRLFPGSSVFSLVLKSLLLT